MAEAIENVAGTPISWGVCEVPGWGREVVDLLRSAGYERWLVLEQDTAITGEEPPVGRGPVIDARTSIDYLHSLAPARRERVAES
jgi:hypothetical protein